MEQRPQVSRNSIYRLLTDVLGILKAAARWVPQPFKRTESWERGHFASLASTTARRLELHQTTSLPHPPYSPDMSPPDFDLFGRLKEPLRGKRFESLNDLKNAAGQVLKSLNRNNSLDGNQRLPHRCKVWFKIKMIILKDINASSFKNQKEMMLWWI